MPKPNAFLVTSRESGWVIGIYRLTHVNLSFVRYYQLFVPNRFVLGKLKKGRDGFELSSDRFFYREFADTLSQYQKSIAEGNLEIREKLDLPDTLLTQIGQYARAYPYTKDQLSEAILSIGKYLIESGELVPAIK